MDIYLSGVFWAFLIGLLKLAITTYNLNSYARLNFAKVGFHYDVWSGQYTGHEEQSWRSLLAFAFYNIAIGPWFSWLGVVFWLFTVTMAFLGWLNNRDVPEELKKFRFKFNNVNLPKEDVIIALKELRNITGVNDPAFNRLPEDDVSDANVLIDSDEFGHSETELSPEKKTYSYYSRSPDYISEFFSTYEYKFEGSSVSTRLIEQRCSHYGKEEWEVKDNVLLVSEIESNSEDNIVNMAKSRIDGLRPELEWKELSDGELKFFILSKHPEIIGPRDLRKLMRAYQQRILNGVHQARKALEGLPVKIVKSNEGYEIKFAEGADEAAAKRLEFFFSPENFNKYNISISEFQSANLHLRRITDWLDSEEPLKKLSA